MEKKSYVCPKTEFFLMQVRNHLLENSPIGEGEGGNDPLSRKNKSWDED